MKSDRTLKSNAEAARAEPVQIPKICTGIAGLDEVLHGGFPESRTTLIKGSAGTGKTVLGLEFLVRSAARGEPVVFMSFEETAEALRQNALAAGWDIAAMESAGTFLFWDAKIDRSAALSGEFSISSLLAALGGIANKTGAKIIMIDAVDNLMRIFDDPVREQNELYRLHDWLTEHKFTALLTAKILPASEPGYRYAFMDYMADCVLLLDLRVLHQISTRRLRVVKYRGSGFYSNEYPYIITEKGNIIMPVTGVRLEHNPSGERISTGNANLDELLHGGYYQGSSIVISGRTGCGKTTLASTFTEYNCTRGAKILYISFEESEEAVISAMKSPGIDLQSAVQSGRLIFHTIMPEALTSEAHLHVIMQHIEQHNPNHIVVDAISACGRMGSAETAFDFLVRLINFCKQEKVTCLMTNQISSKESREFTTGMGISSLVDTMIVMQYTEHNREIGRDLIVVKSRGTHHSNRHHRLSITHRGIRIQPSESV